MYCSTGKLVTEINLEVKKDWTREEEAASVLATNT